jgi:hypothetical protein
MSNYCSICCVSLSNAYKLKCHLSTALHKKRAESNLQFKCVCGKSFTKSSNLSRHKKKCTFTPPNIETSANQPGQDLQVLQDKLDKKDQENQEMRQEMRELKKQVDGMDELKKQVEILLQQAGKNNTTNNNIENQTNIETQNIIVVNSFKHENIDHITDQFYSKLINNNPYGSVQNLIKHIHFDPQKPENNNVRMTNKKLDYAEIVQNNKWVTANKKEVIDEMITKSYDLLDDSYTENRHLVSANNQDRFDNFQYEYSKVEENTPKPNRKSKLAKEVDLVLINGTKEIHK